MCLSGVLCAAVFISTAYLHIPSNTGYIHLGDTLIYLAACLLPTPYAVFAGAVGAMLADLLGGYIIWAPGTAVIKALAVLCFSHKTQKIICARNLTALVPAAVLCIGGYYLYEAIITMSFVVPIASLAGNTVQAIAGCIGFVLLGLAADKLKLRDKLHIGGQF